jgi:hypothetical protein
MSDKLTALFEKFVTEARTLLIEEVQGQLAAMAGGGGGGQPDPLLRAKGKPGPKPKGAMAPKKAKWAKRTPEELEALTKSLVSYLKKNPGQRSEQIAAGLGTTTKDLALPLGALVEAKQLKTAGQRRGMTYTVKG